MAFHWNGNKSSLGGGGGPGAKGGSTADYKSLCVIRLLSLGY